MIIKGILASSLLAMASVFYCAAQLPDSSSSLSSLDYSHAPLISPIPEKTRVDVPFKKPIAERPLIIIDPGHGGDDFGTQSASNPKYHEKNLNLSTAFLVRSFLQQFGYTVVMTRLKDIFIPLDQRALFANEREAKIFVSIHFNSAPSKEAEGIEVFYYRNEEDKLRSAKSKRLAKFVLDKIIKNTEAKSRGIKHGNFAVIRQTQMPAVLIEGGFLTNADEMDRIRDTSYLKSLSWGIAQGIQDYLGKAEKQK